MADRGNPLREALRSHRVIGTFLKLPATEVLDIIAGAGFDFVIVDLEHSQLSERDASTLLRYSNAIGLLAVVRVPAPDAGLINRLLEAGATGLQLSTVRRVADVRALVNAACYPPHGRRSVSLSHPVAGYGAVSLRDAVAVSLPLLIGQIETAGTDDPLPDILRAGLDVAFIGTTDLLVDLAFDVSRLKDRIVAIEEAVQAAGVAYGSFAAAVDAIPPRARYIALSSDLAILAAAMKAARAAPERLPVPNDR